MKDTDGFTAGIAAAITIIALAIAVLHAHVVYGDWTCALAHCIKAKP